MIENSQEWLAAALPTLVNLTAFFVAVIALAVYFNHRRFQKRKDRRNEKLAAITQWVQDSIEFYSTHYAHLAAGAFTEDEVLHKLSQLAPTRQNAAVQAGRLADLGLDTALEDFNLVEFQIFNLAGKRTAPPSEEYRIQLGLLRAAGEGILEQVELLKR